MELNDYQKGARKTRSSPPNLPYIYPALGLGGEAGECLEIVKKMARRGESSLSPEKTELLKGEIGDVLWYASALADDAGLTLEEIASFNLEKLRLRKAKGEIKERKG